MAGWTGWAWLWCILGNGKFLVFNRLRFTIKWQVQMFSKLTISTMRFSPLRLTFWRTAKRNCWICVGNSPYPLVLGQSNTNCLVYNSNPDQTNKDIINWVPTVRPIGPEKLYNPNQTNKDLANWYFQNLIYQIIGGFCYIIFPKQGSMFRKTMLTVVFHFVSQTIVQTVRFASPLLVRGMSHPFEDFDSLYSSNQLLYSWIQYQWFKDLL